MMCAQYKVTRAGYYAWCKRERSARAVRDDEIIE